LIFSIKIARLKLR